MSTVPSGRLLVLADVVLHVLATERLEQLAREAREARTVTVRGVVGAAHLALPVTGRAHVVDHDRAFEDLCASTLRTHVSPQSSLTVRRETELVAVLKARGPR